MAVKRLIPQTFFRARLSRHILLWMFVSLLLIKSIIVVPSVWHRQSELVDHLHDLYIAQLDGLLDVAATEGSLGDKFTEWGDRQMRENGLLGGILIGTDGQLLGQFGQVDPTLTADGANYRQRLDQADSRSQFSRRGTLWHLTHLIPQHQRPYLIILTQSHEPIATALMGYKLWILALVLVISVFVTVMMVVVLDRIIIARILRLQQNLKKMGQALQTGDLTAIQSSSLMPSSLYQDELSNVQLTFVEMARQLQKQFEQNQLLYQRLKKANGRLASFNQQLADQVSERTAELERRFLEDALTGLPNRNALRQTLQQRLEPVRFKPFVLFYLDCDQFLLVNNSFGYAVGDRLLCQIAERLNQLKISDSLLVRLGADEFCLLTHRGSSLDKVCALAEVIQQCFQDPFWVDNYEVYLSVSLGIVIVDQSYCLGNPEDALRDAETAMNLSKQRRAGAYRIFNTSMHQATKDRLTLEMDLRRALQNQELFPVYQPIIDLKTLTVVGFEALVRWQHPQLGLISPAQFIPCAEETGLIIPLGMNILRQACHQLQALAKAGLVVEMSVNISPYQFTHPNLIAQIDQVLTETRIAPACLKLEITESVIFENPQTAIALTQALRSRQIKISIDDFGTGYSSLSYLTQFPADTLKIDRSFIQAMTANPKDQEVVKAIINLGHALNIEVLAEGIETPEQYQSLQAMGCLYGQGYYFAKPLPADQALAYGRSPLCLDD